MHAACGSERGVGVTWGPFTLSPRQRSPDPGRRTASPCTPCSTVFSFFISCYGKFQTKALLNAMSIEVCGKLLATRPIAPERYVLSLAVATKCLFMNKQIFLLRAITLRKFV